MGRKPGRFVTRLSSSLSCVDESTPLNNKKSNVNQVQQVPDMSLNTKKNLDTNKTFDNSPKLLGEILWMNSLIQNWHIQTVNLCITVTVQQTNNLRQNWKLHFLIIRHDDHAHNNTQTKQAKSQIHDFNADTTVIFVSKISLHSRKGYATVNLHLHSMNCPWFGRLSWHVGCSNISRLMFRNVQNTACMSLNTTKSRAVLISCTNARRQCHNPVGICLLKDGPLSYVSQFLDKLMNQCNQFGKCTIFAARARLMHCNVYCDIVATVRIIHDVTKLEGNILLAMETRPAFPRLR